MNYWRQATHIMDYFKGQESAKGERILPSNFMTAFLEVSLPHEHCLYSIACMASLDWRCWSGIAGLVNIEENHFADLCAYRAAIKSGGIDHFKWIQLQSSVHKCPQN